MSRWRFHNPVNLRFGDGVLDEIGTLVAGRPYVLVTHPDMPMRPWRDRVTELAGKPVSIIDAIEPNPSLRMLERVCAQFEAVGCAPELIVALGGGSVIDSVKFLAAGHGQFAPVLHSLETGVTGSLKALPFLAVPTTAGTGSDLTKWATVWDPEQGRKLSLNRDDLYAEAALVDPRITATLPWSMTLASGLDALSHALESIWNVNANPVTRGYAVQAVRDIMAALPQLKADLSDAAARGLMALGATRAGLAFSNTQTALAHNISYPITLDYQVPHGIACSFCLPQVMTAAVERDTACDNALAELFGADLASAPMALRTFLTNFGVAATPAAFGIGAAQWSHIVEDAFAGPRGRNFIGILDQFPLMAAAAG